MPQKTKFQVRPKHVLVRVQVKTTTPSGIVISTAGDKMAGQKTKEEYEMGRSFIEQVGDGVEWLKEGDEVKLTRGSLWKTDSAVINPHKIEVDKKDIRETYYLFKEDEILIKY